MDLALPTPGTPPPPAGAATTTIDTPDGAFTIIEAEGAVLSSGWTDAPEDLTGQIHPSIRARAFDPAASALDPILDAVQRYYDGDFAAIRSVRVDQASGPFRVHAWDVLRMVEPGEPVTYLQYAERAGKASAVRAAAGACAKNAAALFVPCHRIIRTDGTLGGFRWGVEVKQRLLDREAGRAVPA
ncbi:methylated-DNA--[protein]-cysteine S-methyltransferase [Arthrobacter agilis]|uniref:methylated-DNA--[protein]-cysteine S-methyltransferase n=1 Tax=Arthrobacter agilis TaxID=37921 RepID=UPI000B35A2FF|nr:methylated-DNA--[protein]-cysteine S-methyltransferase [Arthrobacter agilis]OUM45658.1 cysteine methyltransferase [Arthrobacter agilis]PPB44926.1 methylated-DNA--[protein]-cysteine S-methyltransferase [Arthrobacter agilis]TPV27630.1 methylated-DNA--[protein]-cysteine S-methyltransferase [Arthrobacter agilis]WDF34452.1 methylated-DNA--[protein]-cysteine S-methyltransferase [Arthrobacter agilis]VDR31746.1 Regulatory protein of adaptative response [Arthrobacter agilis]